ncbi:MAG: hypothetical protein KAT04_11570 [Methylococcales bacterium]|nr:hypothetical protein [Methylococcales bacterium]
MNVLFKNIPIGIGSVELIKFIDLEFKNCDFERGDWSVSESAIEMLEKQDSFTRPIEQFSLVRINPPLVAKIIIQKLNGCYFNELQITVREYSNRSISNDSRHRGLDILNNFVDRRIQDRRKYILVYSRLI